MTACINEPLDSQCNDVGENNIPSGGTTLEPCVEATFLSLAQKDSCGASFVEKQVEVLLRTAEVEASTFSDGTMLFDKPLKDDIPVHSTIQHSATPSDTDESVDVEEPTLRVDKKAAITLCAGAGAGDSTEKEEEKLIPQGSLAVVENRSSDDNNAGGSKHTFNICICKDTSEEPVLYGKDCAEESENWNGSAIFSQIAESDHLLENTATILESRGKYEEHPADVDATSSLNAAFISPGSPKVETETIPLLDSTLAFVGTGDEPITCAKLSDPFENDEEDKRHFATSSSPQAGVTKTEFEDGVFVVVTTNDTTVCNAQNKDPINNEKSQDFLQPCSPSETDQQPQNTSVTSHGDDSIVRAEWDSGSLQCQHIEEILELSTESPVVSPHAVDPSKDDVDSGDSSVDKDKENATNAHSILHDTLNNAASREPTAYAMTSNDDTDRSDKHVQKVETEPNTEKSTFLGCEAAGTFRLCGFQAIGYASESDATPNCFDQQGDDENKSVHEAIVKSEERLDSGSSVLNESQALNATTNDIGKDCDDVLDHVEVDSSNVELSSGLQPVSEAAYQIDPASQRDDRARCGDSSSPEDAQSMEAIIGKPDPPKSASMPSIAAPDPLANIRCNGADKDSHAEKAFASLAEVVIDPSEVLINESSLEEKDSTDTRSPMCNENTGTTVGCGCNETMSDNNSIESAAVIDDDCSYEEIILDDDDEIVEYVDEILEDDEEDVDEEASFTEVTYDSKDFQDEALEQSKGSMTIDASLQKRSVIKSSAQKALENEEARKLKEAEETRKNMEFRLARQHSFARKDEELKRRLEEEEARHIREAEEKEHQRMADQRRLAEMRAHEAAVRIAQQETVELRRRLEEEEARRKIAEAEAHRLAAEAAAKEKAEAERVRRAAEEAEKRARDEKKRQMEEEVRILKEKLEATKRSAEEAKAKQLEEKQRMEALVNDRRKEKKIIKKKRLESAVPLDIHSSTENLSQVFDKLNASTSSVRGPSPTPPSKSPVAEPKSPELLIPPLRPIRSPNKVVLKSPVAPPKSPLSTSPRRSVIPASPAKPASPVKMHPPPIPSPTISPQKLAAPPAAPSLFDEAPKADQNKVYYTADQLRKQSVPGLDYKNREQYLHPDEFQAIFEVSLAEFNELPAWKRNNLKRKKKLF